MTKAQWLKSYAVPLAIFAVATVAAVVYCYVENTKYDPRKFAHPGMASHPAPSVAHHASPLLMLPVYIALAAIAAVTLRSLWHNFQAMITTRQSKSRARRRRSSSGRRAS